MSDMFKLTAVQVDIMILCGTTTQFVSANSAVMFFLTIGVIFNYRCYF